MIRFALSAVVALLLLVSMSRSEQSQTVESKKPVTIVIQVRPQGGDLHFFGKFMCNINSVCSFTLNDLNISVFPVESTVGMILRSAKPITDLHGKENFEFIYNYLNESIPLYSTDDGGNIKGAGILEVRASSW